MSRLGYHHLMRSDDRNTLGYLADAWDSMGKAKSALRRIEHRLDSYVDDEPDISDLPSSACAPGFTEVQPDVRRKVSRLDDKYSEDLVPNHRARNPLSALNSRRSFSPAKHVTFEEGNDNDEDDTNDNESATATGAKLSLKSSAYSRNYSDSLFHGNPISDDTSLHSDVVTGLSDNTGNKTEYSVTRDMQITYLNDGLPVKPSSDYSSYPHRDFYTSNSLAGFQHIDADKLLQPGRRLTHSMKDLGRDSDSLTRINDFAEKQRSKSTSPRVFDNEEQHHHLQLFPPKEYHDENDPVLFQPRLKWESSSTAFPLQMTRKLASGPPAPTYKGFSGVETRYRGTHGKITDKHSRKVNKPKHPSAEETTKKTKKAPSKLKKTEIDVEQSKPKNARVIASKKPTKYQRKDYISTSAWREGQKLVMKELGPAKPEQDPVRPKEKLKITKQSSGHLSTMAGSSHMAKDIMAELEKGDEDDDEEEEQEQDDEEHEKVQPSDKPKPKPRNKLTKRKHPIQPVIEKKEPAPKVRHYDSDSVRKYIKKQQAKRRLEDHEHKKAEIEAAEHRRKQLQELFTRQRATARVTPVQRATGHHLAEEKQVFDETFNITPVKPSSMENKDDMEENDGSDTLTGASDEELTPRADEKNIAIRPNDSVDHEMTIAELKSPPQPSEMAERCSTPISSNFVEAYPEAKQEVKAAQSGTVSQQFDNHIPSGSVAYQTEKGRRIQALREAGASLQNRLNLESRKIARSPNVATAASLPIAATRGSTDEKVSNDYRTRQERITGSKEVVFDDNLPGVGDLGWKLEETEAEEAAKTIQAAYRGYTVRQSMDWMLPTGDHTRPQKLEDTAQTHIHLKNWADFGLDGSADSTLIPEASNRQYSLKTRRSPVNFTPAPRYSLSTKPSAPMIPVDPEPDPYSVLSIYTRQLLHKKNATAKHSPVETSQVRRTRSSQSLETELVTPLHTSGEQRLTSERQMSEMSSRLSESEKNSSQLPVTDSSNLSRTGKSDQSKSYSSVHIDKKPDPSSETSTLSITTATPENNQGNDLKHSSDMSVNSDLSSLTQPEDQRSAAVQTSFSRSPDRGQLRTGYPYAVDTTGRLSPSALERRLTAELNLLDGMEESVRQLTDVERARAVSLAQQETVSLAQILKARQQAHDRELQALKMKAQKETFAANRQLEESRQRVEAASTTTAETIAQVRQESALALQQSTKQLLDAQAQAMKATSEVTPKTQNTNAVLPEDALRLATETASAAATAAVKAALIETKGNRRQQEPVSMSSRTSYTETFDSTTKTDTFKKDLPQSNHSDSTVKTAHDVSQSKDVNDSIIRTDPAVEADVQDKTESISEELPSEKGDFSLSFDETMTEDEIEEHSFRMVLPSEGHRLQVKKDDQKSDPASVSSDDFHLSGSSKLTLDDVSVPFHGENEFSKFTSEMVKQYMKEEEMRAKHQAALLKLREKALREKTKAELAWLSQQTRNIKDKRADDAYPLIKKKQKIIIQRMQQEKSEIKRLREAQEMARKERKFLWLQQQELEKLKQSTQQVKAKIKQKADEPADDLSLSIDINTEDELSIALSEHSDMDSLPSSPRKKPVDATKDYKSDSEVLTGDARSKRSVSYPDAKVLQKLKRLKLDPKYLTVREQKLQQRKKHAEDLIAWKKRLDEEEKDIYKMERKALKLFEPDEKRKGPKKQTTETQDFSESESSISIAQETSTKPKKPAAKKVVYESESSIAEESHIQAQKSLSEASIPEVLSQSKSVKFVDRSSSGTGSGSTVAEEIQTVTTPRTPRTPTSGNHDSADESLVKNSSIHEDYSNDTFVSAETSSAAANKPIKTKPAILGLSDKSLTPRSPRTPRSAALLAKKRGSESESEDSFSYTPSETASDQSDVEGRVRALNEDLKRRKAEAERLNKFRKEQRRRNKDRLKAQEASLKKQVEAYETYIQQVKADLQKQYDSPEATVPSIKPQIKQPKVAESKRLRRTGNKSETTENDVKSESSRSSVDDQEIGAKLKCDEVVKSSSKPEELPSGSDSTAKTSSATTETITKVSRHDDSSIKTKPNEAGQTHVISVSEGIIKDEVSDSIQSESQHEESAASEKSAIDKSLPILQLSLSDHKDNEQVVRTAASVPNNEIETKEEVVIETEEIESVVEDGDTIATDIVSEVHDDVRIPSLNLSLKEDEKEEKQSPLSARESDAALTGRSIKSEYSLEFVDTSQTDFPRNEQLEDNKSAYSYATTPRSELTRTISGDYSDDFSDSYSHSERSEEVSGPGGDGLRESMMSDDEASESVKSELSITDKSKDSVIAIVAEKHDEEKVENKAEPVEALTPVQSPSTDHSYQHSMENDKKSDSEDRIVIGDYVMIGGVRAGVLKFKGQTAFAPGYWAGIELDHPDGTNSGSKDGVEYFRCKPDHGIFAPADKISKFIPQNSMEKCQISEVEDLHSDSSEHTLTEEPSSHQLLPLDLQSLEPDIVEQAKPQEISVPTLSQKSEEISLNADIAHEEPPTPRDDESVTDVSVAESDIDRLISSAALAVEDFDEQRKDDEMKLEDIALTKQPEVAAAREADSSEENAQNIADTAAQNMLNEALSHMFEVRKKQIDRLSIDSSQDGDSGIPSEDKKSTPALSQTSEPASELDGEENESGKGETPEREVPPRPTSPILGEATFSHEELRERLENLDHVHDIDDDQLQHEWFEDDFGLGQRTVPDHPPPPYPGTPPAAALRALELQKLTEQLFYAVPHKQNEVRGLVSQVVDVFWEKRRYGESMEDVEMPAKFYEQEEEGLDLESNSCKVYKQLIFDLVGEYIKEMYRDEEDVEPPPWAKPKQFRKKLYYGKNPPTTSDKLKEIMEEEVLSLVGLKEGGRELKSNKWSARKKKDQVDDILVQELQEEEPDWVNYDDDELAVKMQLADSIFESLLQETATVFKNIQHKINASHQS
ncbi:centrosome-associated protein 350-like [Tubulanus polymorphus]|uniref:centrosome-associated protein 350-like n=1 Tax=Tubulanus polymorphus TaxID=672921 RepID=UPI003DA57766